MIDTKYVGALIRNLRVASDLTLAAVAERTGLSKGVLSRIEHGLVSPSISTLGKIADALDVQISAFFQEDGVARISYLPVAKRRRVRQGGAAWNTFVPLTEEGYGRKLFNPFLVRLARRGFKPVSNTVPGDQFIFVTSGSMEYEYAGTVYRLNPGDALFFRGEVPHGPTAIHTPYVEYVMVLARRFTHIEPATGAEAPGRPAQA